MVFKKETGSIMQRGGGCGDVLDHYLSTFKKGREDVIGRFETEGWFAVSCSNKSKRNGK